MLLRRVIEHVRQQHWTAVWIDLAVVVVGVADLETRLADLTGNNRDVLDGFLEITGRRP